MHAISTKPFLTSRLFPDLDPDYPRERLANEVLFPLPDKPAKDILLGDITPLSEWLCEHPGPDPERRDAIWCTLTSMLCLDEVDAGATVLFRSDLNMTYYLELLEPVPEWTPRPGTLKKDGTPFHAHPRLVPDALVDYWCGTGLGDWQGCRLVPRALVPWFFGLLQQALTNLRSPDIATYDDLNDIETPWYVEEFGECVASISRVVGHDDYDFLALTIRG